MGSLLALASAVCYGVADFAGGMLARRAHFVAVALVGQVGGFVLTLAVAPAVPASLVGWPDLAWGAASGVGSGIGMVFLYRGLSHGEMSVVLPVSAVGGVALPVAVGIALLGERPSLLGWLGIAVTLPALWLVSQTRDRGGPVARTAVLDAVVASMGIALQYAALAQAGAGSGIWPVVASRFAAIATILPLVTVTRPGPGPGPARRAGSPVGLPPRTAVPAAVIGATAALGLVLYLLATRRELVTVAVVLASLYPAIPVLLGITALRERLSWRQTAGLLGAGAAIALLTAG